MGKVKTPGAGSEMKRARWPSLLRVSPQKLNDGRVR